MYIPGTDGPKMSKSKVIISAFSKQIEHYENKSWEYKRTVLYGSPKDPEETR